MRPRLLAILFLLTFSAQSQEVSLVLQSIEDTAHADLRNSEWGPLLRSFTGATENQPLNFYFGETSHAVIDCRSDWYVLEDRQWVNQYMGWVHGYNCQSRRFFEDGKLVQYGGYGIWRGQSLVLHFTTSNEWALKMTESTPEYLIPGPGFHYDEDHVLLFPGRRVDGIVMKHDRPALEKNGHLVDREGNWTTMKCEVPGYDLDGITYRNELLTDKYRIYEGRGVLGEVVFIQDRSTNSIYLTSFENTFSYTAIMLRGDTLSFIGEQSSIHYSVQELIAAGTKVVVSKPKGHIGYYGLIPVIIALLWRLRKRSLSSEVNDVPNPLNARPSAPDFYYELLEKDGMTFTTEELNDLFLLSDLNFDVIRKRRSRLLKSINEHHSQLCGKELITRIKDPSDKRHIIYTVSK